VFKRYIILIIGIVATILVEGQADLSSFVTLKKKYTNATELLDSLSSKTNLQFSYRSDVLSGTIKLRRGNRQLQEIIDYLCYRTQTRYTIIDSTVIIRAKPVSVKLKKRIIAGKVVEDSTGEIIPYAYIYIENSSLVYKANRHGYFSFVAPPRDSFSIFCISAYESGKQIDITQSVDSFLVVVLPKPQKIKPLILKAKKKMAMSNANEIGTIKISQKKLKQLPPFLGESDIINALTLSPGVAKGTEGNNGLFIRGGSPDQNLITLDGAVLYNPNHFFGLFSPFNTDAIRNVSMQTSGFGADIGGRLSAHLGIDLKEGNKYQHKHSFSISPIAITASSNGPIISPKTTYMVSARRSYFDLVITPLLSDNNSTGFFFVDFNAKVTHQFNAKNKLSLSIFSFQDKAFNKSKFNRVDGSFVSVEETNDQSLNWGNNLILADYKGKIRKNIFLNSNVYYTSFKYRNNVSYSLEKDSINEKIESIQSDYNFKSDVFSISSNHNFTWWVNARLKSKFGFGYFYHSFLPSSSQFVSNSNNALIQNQNLKEPNIFANETFVYAETQYKVSKAITLNTGLRYSSYHTTTTNYFNPQPRMSARIALPKRWYIKPALTQTVQYLHFSTNNTIGLPVDLWLPATNKLKPETSQQASVQVQKLNKKVDFSAEFYYKRLNNLIDYAEGIEYLGNSSFWENKFVQGQGKSYGFDLIIEKKIGMIKGWFGYTWSVNNRQFDSINNGKVYPFKYDRRNNFSAVLSSKLKKGVEFYSSWVYGSGAAITLPVGRYPDISGLPSKDILIYGERNSNRLNDYHRLDVGLKSTKIKKHFTRIWNFSIYNIYNRQNPFYITTGTDSKGNRAFVQVSLLPLLPSVSYKIEIN